MRISTFIFLSILSVIFSLLVYFGIIRYIILHYTSTKKYVENYKNISNHKEKKVVIVLPVKPNNSQKLKPVFNSILDQTVKVDNILLHTIQGKFYNFSNDIKNASYISKCGQDYGEGQGIIPAILREDNSDTIIIVLKDNIVYGKDFIQTLLEEMKEKDKFIKSKYAIAFKPKFFKEKTSQAETTLPIINENWYEKYLLVPIENVSYTENYPKLDI